MQSAEPCPSNLMVAFRRASEDDKLAGVKTSPPSRLRQA